MGKISAAIVSHARAIIVLVIFLTALASWAATKVTVNYDMTSYVPAHAPSTIALEIMEDEFDSSMPNARVYVPHVDMVKALEIKEKIAGISGVTSVIWLDDVSDIHIPLQMQPSDQVERFYRDGTALYQVSADLDRSVQIVDDLRAIATDEGAVEGQLVDLAMARHSTSSEIATIMAIMIPLGLILLCLSTRSWLEPIILLATISVAIAVNMGTNALASSVSFITQAVVAVLQLAVSMDYGIFLLHARDRRIAEGKGEIEAIRLAIVDAAYAIISSSMTTVLGFLALVAMSFRLGPDLGFVLAKGVALSLVAVIVVMPAFLIVASPLIYRTSHRQLLPRFVPIAHFVSRWMRLLIVIAILLPICWLAQGHNHFLYGNSSYPEQSRAARDRDLIEQHFGREVQLALLIPRGESGRGAQLESALGSLDQIRSITSVRTMIGADIPQQIVENQAHSLLSDRYERIIMIADCDKEGEESFALVDRIRSLAESYYPSEAHLVGEPAVNLDMKTTITKDNRIVTVLAIISISLVLILTFRSIVIPIILILTIEGSIWINLAVPYFAGEHMAYIGYLIVSTVQLGATVDYAILFTQHYLDHRQRLSVRESVFNTIVDTFRTLLIPALILTLAGVVLAMISSMEIISQLGAVLGRGAALSFIMVNLFLPAILCWCDPIISSRYRRRRDLIDSDRQEMR